MLFEKIQFRLDEHIITPIKKIILARKYKADLSHAEKVKSPQAVELPQEISDERHAADNSITDKKKLEGYKDYFSDYADMMGYNQARIKDIGSVYEIKVKNYRYDVKDFKNPRPPDTFIYVGYMIIEAKLLRYRNEKGEIPWTTVTGLYILSDALHHINIFHYDYPVPR